MDLVTPKFKAMEDAFLIKMESEEIELLNSANSKTANIEIVEEMMF